jgi:hypothetical protein
MMDVAQQRQLAHAYLDQLPPAQVSAVRSLLESMIDPLAIAARQAPLEDQELVAKRESLAHSVEWLNQNRNIPIEEVLADFGLSRSDLEVRRPTVPGSHDH